MRLHGLGDSPISDTTQLNPGQMVSFTVHGDACSGVHEQDITDGLNNWLSQMMTLVSVSTNMEGYIPTIVDVDITATVVNAIPAGELRGQIIQALAALSSGANQIVWGCSGVYLKNNVLNAAPGSSASALPPSPSSGIPWNIVVPGALVLVGAVLLTGQRR